MSDTVVEVIEHPLSPYAQKVKIALAEKGVPFSARIPDAMGSGATPDAFRRANFRGEVPVLVVAGRTLFDSTIILEFIEDHWPDPPLLPADPFERARAPHHRRGVRHPLRGNHLGLGRRSPTSSARRASSHPPCRSRPASRSVD